MDLLLAPMRRWLAPSTARTLPVLRLARGSVQTLQLRAGTRVYVAAGRIWLTVPGDADDHFIGAGQVHRLQHGGAVVIEGDSAEPAQLRLF